MRIDDCFRLGHIVKRHGLKGEVSILLDVDYPEDYTNLESVFVATENQLIPFFIERLQLNGLRGIAKFEEVDDHQSADRLLKCDLYLPLESLPKLDDGQFYYHEIIGYSVIDSDAKVVGTITEVYDFPQQDILAVAHEGKELLIPIIDQITKHTDHNNRELHVALPDGLLEIYLSD